ncbi:hypothetical protein [Bradyrhizobium sp. dw_78]|uniref:hypothetical protein n=1 Tax=Bradyrhizobium sp. dw_78 TaxID=2719793 RepID=UPI001BD2A882|nr:hypothetical protein [Bradyrhizobium sp. dw_78]
MKWPTEYLTPQAMIASQPMLVKKVMVPCGYGARRIFEIAPAASLQIPPVKQTVSSRREIIVEIISPFAFTFKIPFH